MNIITICYTVVPTPCLPPCCWHVPPGMNSPAGCWCRRDDIYTNDTETRCWHRKCTWERERGSIIDEDDCLMGSLSHFVCTDGSFLLPTRFWCFTFIIIMLRLKPTWRPVGLSSEPSGSDWGCKLMFVERFWCSSAFSWFWSMIRLTCSISTVTWTLKFTSAALQ